MSKIPCLTIVAGLAAASCAFDAGREAADQIQDTMMLADSAIPATDSLVNGPAPLPAVPAPAGVPPQADTSPAVPASTPRLERPPTVREYLVDVVFGVAEIEVDSKAQQQQQPIYAAAEYLRVILRGGRRTMETVTNSRGQFFFERVPPGRYDLIFLTAKEDRRVYALPVVIERVPKLELPDVHIPLDSIRLPAARY